MDYLEEKGIGFDVGVTKVPIVPSAVLFDLGYGDAFVRPDKAMGRAACEAVYVIEMQGRIHHHIVMNQFEGLSMKEMQQILQEIWGKGLVLIKHLYKNQKDNRLASYLTKENYKKKGKRWSGSRNLKKPKVTIEIVKETKRKVKLRAPKNFEIVAAHEDFFEEIGWVRYMKAVRRGGMDYGSYEEGSEDDC